MKNLFYLTLCSMLLCTSITAQEKKAAKIVTDYYAWLDAGKLDAVVSLLTDDFKATAPFTPVALDRNAWRGVGEGFKAAFPDMTHEIVSWFADDNKIAVQGIFKGTNTGSMMGNPATGKKVNLSFTTLIELNGKGKIKWMDIQFDNKAFETQLMGSVGDMKKMSENKIRELFSVMDAGHTERFGEFVSSDFTIMNPFLTAPSPVSAFQNILKTQKTAFPDMKHEITEIISDGRYVTTRGVFKGTNTGSMMGNPATGNKVVIPFIVLDEFDTKGKLKYRNVQFDAKSFDTQLMAGINPSANIEMRIRDMHAAIDAANTEKVRSYWSEHGHPHFQGVENTLDEVMTRITSFKKAFPDIHRSLDEVIVNGNKVFIRGMLTGTNKGSFMGKPATNNPVKVSWLALYHLKPDGKIENGWVEFDSKNFEKQLNAKPTKKVVIKTPVKK